MIRPLPGFRFVAIYRMEIRPKTPDGYRWAWWEQDCVAVDDDGQFYVLVDGTTVRPAVHGLPSFEADDHVGRWELAGIEARALPRVVPAPFGWFVERHGPDGHSWIEPVVAFEIEPEDEQNGRDRTVNVVSGGEEFTDAVWNPAQLAGTYGTPINARQREWGRSS